MDIPLHPKVETEIARGREFLDRIRSARRTIAGLRVTVPCPDGDNEIVFGGDGMVVDATFAEDVFGRYPADKLSELLLAMSEEGFAQVSTKVTAEVAGVLEQPMIDHDALELFTSSCAALGVEVFGRRQVPDKRQARVGFERLTAQYPDLCDGWLGLAASGATDRAVLESAYRAIETAGELISASDVAVDAVDFPFDTGLYIQLHARGADGVIMACAAARANDGDYGAARDLLDDRVLAAQPLYGGWVLAVIFFRAKRWHDVRRVLAPLTPQARNDAYLYQAMSVAQGLSAAYLGLWEPAFDQLNTQGQGPIAAASAEALLAAALSARSLGRADTATALLNEAYAVTGIQDNLRTTIGTALSDPGYGIHPTTAARIDARTDYWDANTEPGERDFTRQLGSARREELNAEADAELAEFVGMADVKEQIARLESSVRADKAA